MWSPFLLPFTSRKPPEPSVAAGARTVVGELEGMDLKIVCSQAEVMAMRRVMTAAADQQDLAVTRQILLGRADLAEWHMARLMDVDIFQLEPDGTLAAEQKHREMFSRPASQPRTCRARCETKPGRCRH